MPASGRVLLDTNILIALFAGDATVLAAVQTTTAAYVPAIALGELYYGAWKSARAAANVQRIAELAVTVPILACDAETASVYGELKAVLRTRGTPIPENDLWIAALARQHELTLATRDAHFDRVPGLPIERWL
ncbi:MAG TPA: type II toxin-antitoxin system VapC family toxin [Gemmatimonadaceae bacterium]|jgi:tRNA(fMet)-specific endonuclease VapC|nr:type II toxin-antitoxin system VapC family toxin [Gemmatimonadaceae bacterium]